jgi:hypothetical protein
VHRAELGPDGRLYVANGRQGAEGDWVWRTTEAVVVAGEPGPATERDGTSLVVQPNPARGSATAVLTLEAPADVTLAVYDGLGREVTMLPGRRLVAGRHPFPLDASGWAPGVYVVRADMSTARGARHAVTQRLTVAR